MIAISPTRLAADGATQPDYNQGPPFACGPVSVVGTVGLEPTMSCSQNRRLSHWPTFRLPQRWLAEADALLCRCRHDCASSLSTVEMSLLPRPPRRLSARRDSAVGRVAWAEGVEPSLAVLETAVLP